MGGPVGSPYLPAKQTWMCKVTAGEQLILFILHTVYREHPLCVRLVAGAGEQHLKGSLLLSCYFKCSEHVALGPGIKGAMAEGHALWRGSLEPPGKTTAHSRGAQTTRCCMNTQHLLKGFPQTHCLQAKK